MVTVTGFNSRTSSDDRDFFTLTIQGGVEVVQSKNGNVYMTAKKMSIPSTFSEAECALLIGKELPGEIEKVECEPFEYTNDAGEIFILNHTSRYVVEKKKEAMDQFVNELTPLEISENSPFALV